MNFDNPAPYQLGSPKAQVFAKDTWGGTIHDDFQPQDGDIVALEHWGSSGFANTCLESAGRFGMELGYHVTLVTLVTDAISAFSPETMHAAHVINGPDSRQTVPPTAVSAANQSSGASHIAATAPA